MAVARINEVLLADWNRAIHIDQVIDDDLVRRLTPGILRLRQESNDPITIGIDSPGGSLAALDSLLGLLTEPTQSGRRTRIVTVATNRAYSAAACLLALGDYSVALPHSRILLHDVRYADLDDVTPSKARLTAKELQEENERYALKLSGRVIERLVWNYIDLFPAFKEIRERLPLRHKRYAGLLGAYVTASAGAQGMDIVGFATALFAKISSQNDRIISTVMERLGAWIDITTLHESTPAFRKKGSRVPGLLDGAVHLHKAVAKKLNRPPVGLEHYQDQLKLLFSLAVTAIARQRPIRNESFDAVLERLTRDFALIESINNPVHAKIALALMKEYEGPFFGTEVSREVANKSEEEKEVFFQKFMPNARLFWHFCVLLCRGLFEGDHLLFPGDAQLLGLVDEVGGGGPIESKREYGIKSATPA